MGNRMSLEDQIKANKRLLTRAIREMDRERAQLERDQKRLESEIKKLAQQGQMGAVKVAAKDLVRTRQHIAKFYQMRSTLQGLNLKMQTMKSSNEIAMAMGKMSKAMKVMNKQMKVPKMQELMMEFQKQEAQMEMTQEMMDDVIDDVLSDPTSAESEDAIVKQVLDEIGIDMVTGLKAPPASAPVGERQPADAEVTELEARLQNLRKE